MASNPATDLLIAVRVCQRDAARTVDDLRRSPDWERLSAPVLALFTALKNVVVVVEATRKEAP